MPFEATPDGDNLAELLEVAKDILLQLRDINQNITDQFILTRDNIISEHSSTRTKIEDENILLKKRISDEFEDTRKFFFDEEIQQFRDSSTLSNMLLAEYLNREDKNGDGLKYGHDFIVNDPTPLLTTINNNVFRENPEISKVDMNTITFGDDNNNGESPYNSVSDNYGVND